MARPKKNIVDYFPHKCQSGKTIFILEQKFGNDGYAFWFKLLEILGSTDNHVFDCRNPSNFEFLQAKTRCSEEMTCSILNLLCDLGAIERELWEKRIIWSDNFVAYLSSVYSNRRVETPQKPSLDEFLHVETTVKSSFYKKNATK